MPESRKAIVSAIRRAHSDYLAAWEKHRKSNSEESRADFVRAKRQLDEVQRRAALAVEPSTESPT